MPLPILIFSNSSKLCQLSTHPTLHLRPPVRADLVTNADRAGVVGQFTPNILFSVRAERFRPAMGTGSPVPSVDAVFLCAVPVLLRAGKISWPGQERGGWSVLRKRAQRRRARILGWQLLRQLVRQRVRPLDQRRARGDGICSTGLGARRVWSQGAGAGVCNDGKHAGLEKH